MPRFRVVLTDLMDDDLLPEREVFGDRADVVAVNAKTEGDLLGKIEDDDEFREETAGRPCVEFAQSIEVDQASESLIGECRVGESIAEHDRTTLERGPDHLEDVLPA